MGARAVAPIVVAACLRRSGPGGWGASGPEPAGDDVVGHIGEQAIVAEGVRPQLDERLGDADPLLDRDHACRVVHHEVEVGADGILLGIPRSTALEMVIQTVCGAATMLREPGEHLCCSGRPSPHPRGPPPRRSVNGETPRQGGIPGCHRGRATAAEIA